MRRFLALATLFLLLLGKAGAQPVHTYIDLQTHPTMNHCYGFFDDGLARFESGNPPELHWEHTFSNVIFANYLEDNSGARILVHGAIAPEVRLSRRKARRIVLAQIEAVDQFAEENADKFVVARTPEEVRHYFHSTDKTIFVHSIEGGKKLIDSPEDAQFWAEKGVAFVTLVHLMDDEFGGGAIRPGLITNFINLRGVLRKAFRPKYARGLTERGSETILWLGDAGILTDLTHMNDSTRKDALAVLEEAGIPPLVTHDLYKPLHNHPRGVDREDLRRIYENGGLMSLPISGESNQLYEPDSALAARLAAIENHCPGSVDSYRFTYEVVKEEVEGFAPVILQKPAQSFASLSEEEKTAFAIGFQTDFNGWVNHSRPRVGEEGCFPQHPDSSYPAIETEGLAHPGLLPDHWEYLENEGVDLAPVQRSAEQFLRMWEKVRERRK